MIELRPDFLAEGFIFPEGLRWHDGSLWLTDVFDFTVTRIGMNGEKTTVLSGLPPRTNSMGFLPDGSMIVVASVERKLLHFVNGDLNLYADLADWAPGDLNDLAVDDAGRVYIGDFGYDHFAGAEKRETGLLLIDPDRSIRPVASGLEFPNGTAIINDGRTLVVAETWRGLLTAFDRAEDGSLSNKRLFAELPGRNPDGICADAEGAIWVPSFNTAEVFRVLDGGRITHRASMPGGTASCVLGGEDGLTLFAGCYAGTDEQCMAGERRGQVHMLSVDVPGPS